MSTKSQIEANRRNGRSSKGPKTQKGKATSAKNALKHGLLSQEALLPDEDRSRFAEFSQQLEAEFAPEGAIEGALVTRIIGQLWRLERIGKLEAAVLVWKRTQLLAKTYFDELRGPFAGQDPREEAKKAGFGDLALLGEAYISGENSLAKLSRYESSLLRNLVRVMHELERLQASRKGEHVPLPVAVDINVTGVAEPNDAEDHLAPVCDESVD